MNDTVGKRNENIKDSYQSEIRWFQNSGKEYSNNDSYHIKPYSIDTAPEQASYNFGF